MRTPVVLLVDKADAPGVEAQETAVPAQTSTLAEGLAAEQLHVYATESWDVALALSTDVFFDTVLVSGRLVNAEDHAKLARLVADGHRSLVLMADDPHHDLEGARQVRGVDGVLTRQAVLPHLTSALMRLAQDGDLDRFRAALANPPPISP